jgi:HAD superfamily hydrolase (TIGR01662 family)
MYLPDIQVIMFDADDTLRRCTVPEQNCPYKEGEWETIPGVREHIDTLRKEYPYLRFAIVSNQGGVASGKVEEALAMRMLEELSTQLFGAHEAKVWICLISKSSCSTVHREHIDTLRKEYPYLRFAIVSNQGGVASGKVEEALAMRMLEELSTQLFGAHEAKVWICPHPSKGNCLCRKPSPFLLLEAARHAARDFPTPLQRDQVLYVGDMVSDMHAAASAGFLFLWEYEFFPGRARRDFR